MIQWFRQMKKLQFIFDIAIGGFQNKTFTAQL